MCSSHRVGLSTVCKVFWESLGKRKVEEGRCVEFSKIIFSFGLIRPALLLHTPCTLLLCNSVLFFQDDGRSTDGRTTSAGRVIQPSHTFMVKYYGALPVAVGTGIETVEEAAKVLISVLRNDVTFLVPPCVRFLCHVMILSIALHFIRVWQLECGKPFLIC